MKSLCLRPQSTALLRPADTGVGSDNFHQIKQIARDMNDRLQDEVLDLEPEEYMVAKRFIDKLAFEARFSLKDEQVANND